SSEPAPEDPEVIQAGLLAWGQSSLLLAACAANFVLINTVKFFFEVLTLITPIPLLDAAFEISNKLLCLALALLYAWNPYLALIPGALILLLSILLFAWARRNLRYYKTLLLDPI